MPPPVHGAAMMGKYIHDSKLINEKFDCHYINLTTARDLTDIGKIKIRKLKVFTALLKQIRNEVILLKPNLVYVTPNACGGAFYKDFIVVQMLKRMGCRVVGHYHNKGVATRQDRMFDDFLYNRFFKDIKVILLAETLYQDIKKYVIHDNVYICPNGMPVTDYEHFERASTNNPYTFLFLSNMMEEKGVIDLLKSCSLLKEKHLSFKCNFVGKWSTVSEERFTTIVKELGLDAHVNYLGAKYGVNKIKVLKDSDALVFPTYYHGETFGLVLLEAMEYGMPCISTNVGGIPSVVDDKQTGFLIESRNIYALFEKMSYLVRNPKLGLTMGQAGKRKFFKEFTLDVFENKLTEILSMEIKHSCEM